MGQSTDALLFYGVVFDDSVEDGLDLGDLGAAVEDGYGDGREWFDSVGVTDVEYDTHCSGEYPMPFLCVKGTKTRAWRGSPKRVTTDPIAGHHKWDVELDRALDLLGVAADSPVRTKGWWIASMWN